ncbi:MAG: CRISPR-associated RAMP protein Csx7 [Gemmatales bacterium]|nr:CRISPR-associated RAMP protein Csx7 [Gemmatales bacterium]MCS7159750.1 CRISPR-associated RAMP protein Csx7 [Gemmatales bacterium]MDW8174948.1 CRISPR-associated RAMP protein Csx7 [Gemmatales bacterium]MDW8221332.1 CRISPR-associated RAMP protein Csx7 [Gemmatales bacterium]
MKSFFHFENRYFVTGALRARTALSIGSRASLMPTGSDLPVIKTPEGVPFIPGSSLKGVLRAFTERLVRTLEQLGKRINGQVVSACDPLDEDQRCVTPKIKEQISEKAADERTFTEKLWEKSCTVCRLYGSQWLASRVSFQDAVLRNAESLVRLTEVRDGVGIDRDLGTARTGIKFDFETVPAGAEFDLNLVLENVDDWEVGLVLVALEALGNGHLALGGKTTRGLGWMELVRLQVQGIQAQDLLQYLGGQIPPPTAAERFRQALLAHLS